MIEDMLRRAVERLEELRDNATMSPWFIEEIPETGECRVIRIFDFFGQQIEDIAPGGMVKDDADLIVTLHRTIDAQLAILNAGIVYFHEFHMAQTEGDYHYDDGRPMSPDRMYKITPEGRATLALAQAILGES